MSAPSSLCRSRHLLQRTHISPAYQRYTSTEAFKAPELGIKIPPESPKFIHVPQSVQKQGRFRLQRKGVLPTPRKIFVSRRIDKASPSYLNKVTPEATKEVDLRTLSPEQRALAEYKIRQSALRRQNLGEGLRSLKARKQNIEGARAAKHEAMSIEFQQRVNQPEREDERLTKPSILAGLEPGKSKVLPHPKLAEMVAAKQRRFEKHQESKMNERKDALHTLYMNADSFIVSEADLLKKINTEFEKQFYKENPDRSIWDEEGMPETTNWLLNPTHGVKGGSAIEHGASTTDISNERVKRLAEELTGGKM